MKASEVIQAALDNHYQVTPKNVDRREYFMCHAITKFLKERDGLTFGQAYTDAQVIGQSFLPLLHRNNTSVLTNYLKRVNKRYKYYSTRFNDNTPFCIGVRVEFWKNHIAELQEKGL